MASVFPKLPEFTCQVSSGCIHASINDDKLYPLWLKEMTLYVCAASPLLLPVFGDSSDQRDKDCG